MMNLGNGVLNERNATLVFASQFISTICDKMMSIGLVWFLTTNFSINIVPWFLAVSFLPHVFMSFFSPKIIGRFGILKTVIGTEFFRAIVLIILYGLLFKIPENSHSFLTILFIASFFVGVGSSIFNPAILSLPPQLVPEEQVPGLNALLDTSFSLSNILGAAFSIFLLNIFDIKALVLINALSFAVAGILQSRVKKKAESLSEMSPAQVPISTIAVLKKHSLIRRMLISFLCINIIFTPILVMIPWFVENIYKGSGSDLSIIEGAMGLGAFLTGLVLTITATTIADNKRVGMVTAVCFLFGLFFQIFSLTTTTAEGAAIMFMIGVLSTFLNVQVLTFFQTALHESEVPAIMVAVNLISAASMPLSFALSGLLFPIVDIPKFALISGLLTCLASFLMPAFLKIKKT
jgi:DHA3 family macrolide efflux protein-like MFS transporter